MMILRSSARRAYPTQSVRVYLSSTASRSSQGGLLGRVRLQSPVSRTFATKKPENDPKKSTNSKNSDEAADTNSASKDIAPSKPAKGLEDLYKQPTLSKSAENKETSTNSKEEAALEDGYIRLSPEAEEAWKRIITPAIDQLPASMKQEMRDALDQIGKHGYPPEIEGVIKDIQKTGKISLANATRLVRITYSMRMKQIKKETSEPQEKQDKREEPGSGFFSQDKQDQSKNNSGKSNNNSNKDEFKFGQFKLDTTNIIFSGFATYLLWKGLGPSENTKEITWQEFESSLLNKGLVDKLVVVNNEKVKIHVNRDAVQRAHPDSPAVNPNFYYVFTIGSVESFERKLEAAQDSLGIPSSERIPVSYSRESSAWGALWSFAPSLATILFILWIARRAGGAGGAGGSGGIFGMGKSRAKKFSHETAVSVKFKDVAGADEAKQEIMEFVSFLKDPSRFQKLGAKIPRGAILSGPPGTGKTLLAKATAGESGVPFFSCSGSEFIEIFVGVGPSRVRDLFAQARKNTPCIIFIDEIDAIGKSRQKQSFGGGNDEREATLNQILTEMDGFNTTDQVVVLAGTNRPDVLDSALMRPGRFDRHIAIDRPTLSGRKQIFGVYLPKIKTEEDLEFLAGRLSSLTPGFSGADIANCVNEAALIAARHSAEKVEMTHFEQAIERTIAGLEKKSLVLNPDEKKVVAYHEAGHAICGWFFKYADPLLKVSIIPRGQGALGYAMNVPADRYLENVNQMMDRMAMILGGRVSEELHFETVTSGASDDFNKVTKIATFMVTKYGMSDKIGYLFYEDDNNRLNKPFSEETARNIDSEVRRIVSEAYEQCKKLLTEKKKEVGLIAEELLRKEVLDRDDMIRILGKRPWEDNKEFAKYFDRKSAPPPPEDGPAMPSDSPMPPPLPPTNPDTPGAPAFFRR